MDIAIKAEESETLFKSKEGKIYLQLRGSQLHQESIRFQLVMQTESRLRKFPSSRNEYRQYDIMMNNGNGN